MKSSWITSVSALCRAFLSPSIHLKSPASERLLTAWSLVRVRPGEPNLRRAVGDTAGGLSLFERKSRFSQKIKGLAQGGGKLTALPRAVRNQEIEESPLFSGFLPFE